MDTEEQRDNIVGYYVVGSYGIPSSLYTEPVYLKVEFSDKSKTWPSYCFRTKDEAETAIITAKLLEGLHG